MNKSPKRVKQILPAKSHSFDIDQKVKDKVTLWSLRVLVKTFAKNKFFTKNGFYDDNLAYFLGFDVENYTFNKKELLSMLEIKLTKIEQRLPLPTPKTLSNNLYLLKNFLGLNDTEIFVLEFFILLNEYQILETFTDLNNELNTNQAFSLLAIILNISKKSIEECFTHDSKFYKTSIITLKSDSRELRYKFELFAQSFINQMLYGNQNKIEYIFEETIRNCKKSDLTLENYTYVKKDIDILLPYIEKSLISKLHGVNILLYGLPGTGKTEFVKALSAEIKAGLYEISYADNNDNPLSSSERLKSYKVAQSILDNTNNIIMYDEAEDIFDSYKSIFIPKKQSDKAWINRILESNSIPTIWITNDVSSIDNAIIRRFDMAIEFPIPKKSQRIEIIKKYSKSLIDENTINKLANHTSIAPAFISQAIKVIETINPKNPSQTFEHILNNLLKAQGYKELDSLGYTNHLSTYDIKYINTSMDLENLTFGIKDNQDARICLYGPPGTGKSAYGKYLSQYLDKPFLLKKGSDLLSKWVGGTEKNISQAFEEAKNENAVLVFDEIDSFLQDRNNSKENWEITQVNEMLVQMENFNGVFIATTNLINNLDKASLRRFDLKLNFDYMTPNQSWEFFKKDCLHYGFDGHREFEKNIKCILNLTPGDFATIQRQNRFNNVKSCEDLYNRLICEVEAKNLNATRKIGF